MHVIPHNSRYLGALTLNSMELKFYSNHPTIYDSFPKWGDPNIDPKYQSPYYWETGSPNLGKPLNPKPQILNPLGRTHLRLHASGGGAEEAGLLLRN